MAQQVDETIFQGVCYAYNQTPGEFLAVIDGKVWGRGKKLFTYMTFADGRKVVAQTYPRSKTEGLAGLDVGDRIQVLYMRDRRGNLCVRRAVKAQEPELSCLQRLMQLP